MGWDGPILTDSGGFQVFSLRDTLLAVDDEGVTFRSVYDGEEARFTPELAAEIQAKLGSDVAMCLDVCPPAGVSRDELAAGSPADDPLGDAPARGARGRGQLVFGITQGGGPRASRPVGRGDHRARLRRLRARGPLGRRAETGDGRRRRVGGSAAARRPAAVLHGHRRSRGDPGRDRPWHRHVRLRPADPDGPDGDGDDLPRPAQPPECALRPGPAAARRDVAPARRARGSRVPTSGTWSTSRSCSACGCSASTTFGSFSTSH